MKIYAYYEELGDAQQRRLVELWRANWTHHGWTPEVLTDDDAKGHPAHDAFCDAVSKFPTVNHRGFELASFRRYLAAAQLDTQEPFALADYDVFPRVPDWLPISLPNGFCGDKMGGPGFLHGTTQDFQRSVERIVAYRPDSEDMLFMPNTPPKPHVSDMTILHRSPELWPIRGDILTYYTYPQWEKYDLIHFSVNYIPRGEQIPFLLGFLGSVTGKVYYV